MSETVFRRYFLGVVPTIANEYVFEILLVDAAPDDLKFYDETTKGWIAEPGKFTAYVGSSSTDIRAKATFDYK